jgi:hypothetical protein
MKAELVVIHENMLEISPSLLDMNSCSAIGSRKS